jgi:hypothetical protein
MKNKIKSGFAGKTIAAIIFIVFTVPALSQSRITYEAGSSVEVGPGASICSDAASINGLRKGSGTICTGTLSLIMLTFTAEGVNKNDIRLGWTTSTESNSSGFDIERKTTREGEEWSRIAFVQVHGTTKEQKSYSFEDKNLKINIYKYRLKQIGYNGSFEYFELAGNVTVGAPKNFSISQNYPNPFNPKTKIEYQIPSDNHVTLKVYDLAGREVAVLVDEIKQAGYYSVEFDGTNLATGIYFYRINTPGFTDVKKLALVK